VEKVKDSDDLLMDVHFWIGKYSTQDEYGTAAYKTVELDNYHGGKAIQHREVMQYESELFNSYFPNHHIAILRGGYDSGFHRVDVGKFKPKLMAFKRGNDKKVIVLEVDYCQGSLTDDETFVIDEGTTITIWHSPHSKMQEKIQSLQYAELLADQRNGHSKVVVSDEPMHPKLPEGKGESHSFTVNHKSFDPLMFKMTDENGSIKFNPLGKFNKSALESNDIFVIDVGSKTYIWVGGKSDVDERRESFPRTMSYLQTTDHPFVPITVIKEGSEKNHKHFATLLC